MDAVVDTAVSVAGVLNVDAMECCTPLEGIVKFHWYGCLVYEFRVVVSLSSQDGVE